MHELRAQASLLPRRMLDKRILLFASLPFFGLAAPLAACGSGSSSNERSSDSGMPQEASSVLPEASDAPLTDSAAPLQQARSDAARDPASAISQVALNTAVTANNAFAVSLFAQVRGGPGATNIVTSPLSASVALTMAYAGGVGETATQMAAALQFGGDAGTSIFDGQNALTQSLKSRGAAGLAAAQAGGVEDASASDYELSVVDSVWAERTETLAPSFLNRMATSYGAGVYLEDFINQPDPSRQAINAWVSSQTADKINDLLPPPSITSNTRLVLVNAIHLKFPWANPFLSADTQPGTFTRGDGTAVAPNLMNQVATLPYLDDGQAQIVALPLYDGQLAAVIALPHSGVTLASYEGSLSSGSTAVTVPAGTSLVSLSLPKTTFTTPTFSLKNALTALGMVDAFNSNLANFSGLSSDPLYIDDVLQKAMISMEEPGVEAAAATAVIFADAGSEPSLDAAAPVPMVVNRPYLVTVVDVPTGAILFLGHIGDPTQSGGP
jgi:serpin B